MIESEKVVKQNEITFTQALYPVFTVQRELAD